MIVCIRSVGVFDANKKDRGRGNLSVGFVRTKKKRGGGGVKFYKGGMEGRRVPLNFYEYFII